MLQKVDDELAEAAKQAFQWNRTTWWEYAMFSAWMHTEPTWSGCLLVYAANYLLLLIIL